MRAARNGSGISSVILLKLLLLLVALLFLNVSVRPEGLNRVNPLEPKPGTTFETDIAANGTRSFSVFLKTNEFIQITVDQLGMDLAISIHGPNHRLVHKADWRWSGAESASWVAESRGQYQIDLSAGRRAGVAGKFVLKLSKLRPGSPLDQIWTSAERDSTQIKEDIRKGASFTKLESPIRDVLMLWQQLNHDPGIAQILNVRGFLEQASGKPSAALESYQQALALRRSQNDAAGLAETLHNMAAAEASAGQIRKAHDLYQQSLELRRQAGDLEGIASTFANLGTVHFALGESDDAIGFFDDAIRASQQVADARGEAQARANLGATLAAVGEPEDALIHLRSALALVKDQNDSRGEAYVLANIGKIYLDFADYPRALGSLQRAVELLRRIPDKRGEGRVLVNIGVAHYFSGQAKSAIPYLDQALAVFRETQDRFSEAGALQNLSRAHLAAGESEKAIGYNTEALEISRSIGDIRGEANALRNLAEIERSKQEAVSAMEHLSEARALFERIRYREGEADSLLALARLSWNSGDQTLALTQIEEALKLIESQRSKVTSSRLRGSYFASKRDYYNFYIDSLMQTDKTEAGGRFAAVALEANERARARLLLDTIPLSRIDISNTTDRSLDNRKRSLHREINKLAQQIQTGALNEAATIDRNKRLESLLFELDDVQTQILAVDPRYQRLVSPSLLHLAEIQRQLDPETLLLEYSLGENRSFLWAVTPTSLTAFSDLPSRAEVEQLVRRLYDSVSARSRSVNESPAQKQARLQGASATYRRTAALLSDKLLGPVADHLKTKRVIIVGDGALHFLPFASLPTPGDPAGSPLIVTSEVVNLPSVSVLAALREETRGRPRPRRTLAVIADPVYSSKDPRVANVSKRGERSDARGSSEITRSRAAGLPSDSSFKNGAAEFLEELRGDTAFRRLIYSRQEARTILSFVAESQSRVALDFDADLRAAMNPELGTFRIIHFAVHGLLDSLRPSLSSLILSLVDSNGQEKDGFLRLYQIYNLNLPVDLVVLGACETAIGNEIRGEGLESLARGFMHAGASRLVASLWQVEDESTSELMKSFYRRVLSTPRLSPAAALREAQVEIMRNPRWRDPYYWAGFVFLGDWR